MFRIIFQKFNKWKIIHLIGENLSMKILKKLDYNTIKMLINWLIKWEMIMDYTYKILVIYIKIENQNQKNIEKFYD